MSLNSEITPMTLSNLTTWNTACGLDNTARVNKLYYRFTDVYDTPDVYCIMLITAIYKIVQMCLYMYVPAKFR